MMELWGSEACKPCRYVLKLLEGTPLNFRYVDVGRIHFEGSIPRLVFDDGTQIIGVGPIHVFINEKLKELGLPPKRVLS